MRTLKVCGHAIEYVGQLAALIPRTNFDASRKVPAADRLGAVAEHPQRLGNLPEQKPHDGGAEEDARGAHEQQGLLQPMQRPQRLFVGGKQ